MKNILIFISPTKSFNNPRNDLADNDATALVKVQIENSLKLGWKKEDILLITNFDFQYGLIKATVLPDVEFFERKPQASKINAIVKMFEYEMVEPGQLYWFHDLDAFQLQPISESEIKISEKEISLTDFGGAKKFGGEDRWSGGIIYFKSGSKDIFDDIKALIYKKQIDEEEALGLLVIGNQEIRKRVKKLNYSYNFIGYNLPFIYKNSLKPLKVVHFHPRVSKKRLENKNGYKFFNGDNILNTPLITERLVKLFRYHRII